MMKYTHTEDFFLKHLLKVATFNENMVFEDSENEDYSDGEEEDAGDSSGGGVSDSPAGRIANPGEGEDEDSKGSLGGSNVGGGNNFNEETQSIDGDVTDEEVENFWQLEQDLSSDGFPPIPTIM